MKRLTRTVIVTLTLLNLFFLVRIAMRPAPPLSIHPQTTTPQRVLQQHIPATPLTPKPLAEAPVQVIEQSPPVIALPTPVVESPMPLAEIPKKRHRMSIIIDDLGNNYERAKELVAISRELTFAVLPYTPYQEKVAQLALREGLDLILHLPLEPYDGKWESEPGMIRADISADEMRAAFLRIVDSMPSMLGLNNHMGSKFMEDSRAAGLLLNEVKRLGFLFVDSRTTAGSIGYGIAKNLGIPTKKRDVFLDHQRDEASVSRRFSEALALMRQQPETVVIGHPYDSTYFVLQERLGDIAEYGGELVGISRLFAEE